MPGTFDASCGAVCSDNRRVPPIMWLDNSTILTQRSNGKLVTVNVKGKVEKIVDMKLEEQPGSLPNLDRDDDGNIVYFCDREYLIDVKNKKFSKK
jgi:hypothetical protein